MTETYNHPPTRASSGDDVERGSAGVGDELAGDQGFGDVGPWSRSDGRSDFQRRMGGPPLEQAGGTWEEAAPAATCADLCPKISSRAAWLTFSASSKMCAESVINRCIGFSKKKSRSSLDTLSLFRGLAFFPLKVQRALTNSRNSFISAWSMLAKSYCHNRWQRGCA